MPEDEAKAAEEKKPEAKEDKVADASQAPDGSKGSAPKKSEAPKPKKSEAPKKEEPKGSDIKVDTGVNNDMLALVNAIRSENGAAPLTLNSKLIDAAIKQSYHQASIKERTHEGYGGRVEGRLDYLGYCWSAAGENVAYGYNSVGGAHQAWVNSAGHFANMINPAFTHMGVASATVDGKKYWTQVFGNPC